MIPTDEGFKEDVTYASGSMLPIEQEVARGLRFTHLLLQALHRQGNETVRLIEGLNRLLVTKGITSDTDWADTLDNLATIPQDFPL